MSSLRDMDRVRLSNLLHTGFQVEYVQGLTNKIANTQNKTQNKMVHLYSKDICMKIVYMIQTKIERKKKK